jgi:hypothetical protein
MDTKENTSHQLRDSLKRAGWRVQEADTEVRLIPPDISTPLAEIDRLLGGSGSDLHSALCGKGNGPAYDSVTSQW